MDGVKVQEAEVEGLEAEMASLCGLVNAATGRLVSLVARVIETGAWEVSGIRSPSHWVAWKCGLSASRARRIVSMAKRATELARCQAAFEGGELSEDQMAVVARHAPGANDAEVVEFAREATVSQLERTLRRYNFDTAATAPAPDDEADPQAQPQRAETRTTSFGDTDRGTWRLSAELPLDEGAGIEQALERARHDLVRAGNTRATWTDALMAMAEAYLATGALGRPYSDRHTVMLHLSTDDDGRTGGHLHTGPVLPDALRRLVSCDARIRPVFEVGAIAVNLGRLVHIVPDKTRTVVEERDGGCRGPGCANTKWLQIHHIQHWEDGGCTDTFNLVALCSVCHRRHHLGLLCISGNADDPDGLIFTDARGRVLDNAGKPIPPKQLPEMGNWRHPSGDRLDPTAVQFSGPRDPNADAQIAFIRREREARERRAEAS